MKRTAFTGYVYDFSVDCKATDVDNIKDILKMFVIIKKVFHIGSLFLSSLVSTTSLNCISMKNQECKTRPEVININSNNRIFYPFGIKINKCSGNCKNINNPYANVCVLDVIKDLNIKVFNLMSRTNETRFIKRDEKCKCECRLDAIICNNKQRWNNNKCRCECKELIDKGYVIKDLFGILVIVSVNAIKLVKLVDI